MRSVWGCIPVSSAATEITYTAWFTSRPCVRLRLCGRHQRITPPPPHAVPARSPRPATRSPCALLVGELGRHLAPRSSRAGRRVWLRCGPRPRERRGRCTRSTRPDWVPGGTLSDTFPSSVGTVMVVPSAASGKVIGDVMVRLRPLRPNTGCLAHVGDDVEVARRSHALTGRAPALDPDALPVLDPGRDPHLDRRACRSVPVP